MKKYNIKYFPDSLRFVEGKCLSPYNCTCTEKESSKCYFSSLEELQDFVQFYYQQRFEEFKYMSLEQFQIYVDKNLVKKE